MIVVADAKVQAANEKTVIADRDLANMRMGRAPWGYQVEQHYIP